MWHNRASNKDPILKTNNGIWLTLKCGEVLVPEIDMSKFPRLEEDYQATSI